MSSTAVEEKRVAAIEENEDAAPKKEGPMAELLNAVGKPPVLDDVVEGPVVAVGRARVFVDLHPFGTGIIYGREYLAAREALKNVN
ncbi:hypothetical protein HY417_03220, partial [Candidatus Kaiserbacteria bacterium]|nr:hypothetical protein [Candidatus Kaiserbacteria bacterium]